MTVFSGKNSVSNVSSMPFADSFSYKLSTFASHILNRGVQSFCDITFVSKNFLSNVSEMQSADSFSYNLSVKVCSSLF